MTQIKIAFRPEYAHPLPDGHKFPMEKYELLPFQLKLEGLFAEEDFFCPALVSEEWILKTHTHDYWNRLKNLQLSPQEQRKTGFPHSNELILRERYIMQGSLQAAVHALENGISFNIAGGTHHAFSNRGEGFCLLNDIAIASNYLLENKLAKKILVIDLDVHQGNGTAEIFSNQPKVFTFSMHGAQNYPLKKEFSDLDIALAPGTDDDTYLQALSENLPKLFDGFKPDFVFFQSGVDILESDKLGHLSVSMQACKRRDEMVLEYCHRYQIPVTAMMGGGYSERISDIVEAHANTYRLARYIWG